MKTTLTTAVLLATAASLPAWAGEGGGDPFGNQVITPPVTTTMTVQRGGNTDPFRWSSAPSTQQYSVTRGGNTDPFRWASVPVPAAPTQQRTAGAGAGHPG